MFKEVYKFYLAIAASAILLPACLYFRLADNLSLGNFLGLWGIASITGIWAYRPVTIPLEYTKNLEGRALYEAGQGSREFMPMEYFLAESSLDNYLDKQGQERKERIVIFYMVLALAFVLSPAVF